MKPNKKLSYPFVVEPFQEDCNGVLAWGTLGNLLLRVSSLHAEAHGFGYSYMQQHQQGWVLSRLVIELSRAPRTAETYDIATWVQRIYRQFTDRLYTLTTPEGEPLAQGFSTWALIDYATRQPVSLAALPNGGFSHVLLDETCTIAPPERIRLSDPKCCLEHRAAYTDLDINGHVNSIRYIELLINSFEVSQLRSLRLRRLDVAYMLEGRAGDTLRVYREAHSPTKFAFEVRRLADESTAENADSAAQEQTILRAILTFEE